MRIGGDGEWGGVAMRGCVAVALGLLAVGGLACGDNKPGGEPSGIGSASGTGSDGGVTADGGGGATAMPHPPWVELAKAELNVQGGTGMSPGGQGQNGGTVHLVSVGDISFDPTQPPVTAPSIPAPTAGATAIDTSALVADTSTPGDAVINGTATTGGGDAVRKITVGGDLYLVGTLAAGDAGGGRQGITIQASGTIYISGKLDASGASGNGEAGGAVQLQANQVIVTGSLLTSGGDGPTTGGAAGAIGIKTSQAVTLAGTVEAFGGNASGSGVTGGAAASVTVQAGGAVGIGGALRIRGGAATDSVGGAAQGGAAASLIINSDGAVTVSGTVDARGGLATGATAGAVAGGAAGAVRIGETSGPTTIAIVVPVVASGGDGIGSAGTGGTVTPEPATGNVTIAGPNAIDVTGGNSMSTPGAGGLINGGPRTDPGSGSVHISGDLDASGGSVMMGGSGNGADGGRIDMELAPTDGGFTIDQTADIKVNGGDSGGTGTAGGGGHFWLFTKDGDLVMSGTATALGGNAPDPGGVGGGGGMIYFFTDNNHNAVDVPKGNLLIAATGVLNASGGNGDTGGAARNNGIPGFVATFPAQQEEIAIFLNCDGQHGNTHNWMQNNGTLIAKGGVHNGQGGDVVFHGIPPGVIGTPSADSGDYPVPSGNVENTGDGSGAPGDFRGE
ncbi:MAG TPA: hypothetical protein VHG72_22655 [Polyangia bacterium]|nr:hypothetical protein [Polyangia bacterium]